MNVGGIQRPSRPEATASAIEHRSRKYSASRRVRKPQGHRSAGTPLSNFAGRRWRLAAVIDRPKSVTAQCAAVAITSYFMIMFSLFLADVFTDARLFFRAGLWPFRAQRNGTMMDNSQALIRRTTVLRHHSAPIRAGQIPQCATNGQRMRTQCRTKNGLMLDGGGEGASHICPALMRTRGD